MKIPYGIADFYSIRIEDNVYVDRTDRIRLLEERGRSYLFLRPRRFGKSLWLSTLATYYDLRHTDEHERLFGDLKIGKDPTPLGHRYFVMRWDFSKIDPDPPPWGVNAQVSSRHERIGNELRGYLNTTMRVFLREYRQHLPESLELVEDPFHNFEEILSVIRETPYRLYLLIDEYDNFANEILTDDTKVYRQLVKSDGPFKYLFKWIKGLMAGAGLERLFITGVSPMVMADVTSGMNIARSIFLQQDFADLCGFTDQEVDDLLDRALQASVTGRYLPRSPEDEDEVDATEAKLMMREWYNGYRFALRVPDRVYNPTLVFYFLLHLIEEGRYPDRMLDSNLAADEGKLEYIAGLAAGHGQGSGAQHEVDDSEQARQDTVIDLIRKDEPLEIRDILDRFTLKELSERSAQDTSFLGSYLFYFGMLTLKRYKTEAKTVELVVPNEVMHGLYVERVRRILMPLGISRSAADTTLFAFLRNGDLEPLLDFIEATLFPTFSNRDAIWANELTVKTMFLTLLWNGASYVTHSEPELEHRYADLCLLRRPDARTSSLWDLLFEFKRLSLKDLKMSGEAVRKASRTELTKLAKVRDALAQAELQVAAYEAALEKSRGTTLKLRSFAVVALGFERLVFRAGSVK